MKSRRLTYAPEARADMLHIRTYIGETYSPTKGRSYIQEMATYIRDYAAKGLTGSDRPYFGPNLRSVPYGRYHIIFRVTDTTLDIVGTIAAAQDIQALFQASGGRSASAFDAEAAPQSKERTK